MIDRHISHRRRRHTDTDENYSDSYPCSSSSSSSSRRRPPFLPLLFLLLTLFTPPNVASLTLRVSHSSDTGIFVLSDDRTPSSWSWSGTGAVNGDDSSTLTIGPVTATGGTFRVTPTAVTNIVPNSAQTTFATLPTIPLQLAHEWNYTTETRSSVSILSTNPPPLSQPNVWVLKSFLYRPWVQIVSNTFECDRTILTNFDGSFECRGLQTSFATSASDGGTIPYTWSANLTSSSTGFGRYWIEEPIAYVTIDIKTNLTDNSTSSPQPTIDEEFVTQLLSIAFMKTSESVRLNRDIVYMYNSDDARRTEARLAVGFLWIFMILTASFSVFIASVWLPWSTPCFGPRLLKYPKFIIISVFLTLVGMYAGITVAQGLAGFLILLLLMLLTIAIINILYCCIRARSTKADNTNIHTGASGAGSAGVGVESLPNGKSFPLESNVSSTSSNMLLMSSSMIGLMGNDEDETKSFIATATNSLQHQRPPPNFSMYPHPLGTKQRSYIGWGGLLFLIGAVISVAIFGLWDCDDYLLWDRSTSKSVVEFVPQAIAKATFLVYAFDGFATQIKMNHIFFDVSTQWCGSHYSTQLNTNAQKYTSIYKSFILKYSIDMTMYEPSSYLNYTTVNKWFIRSLASNIRPIVGEGLHQLIVNPCDARLMVFQYVPEDSFIWIKDQGYTVQGVLGDRAWNANSNFRLASMALVRLAPQDYHQFHSPVDGVITMIYTIEGTFHSVNADGMTSGNYAIYNQRTIVIINTAGYANIGEVAYVAIGALCVGSITITPSVGTFVTKGESLGYFQFGGSTIAVLFERDRIIFDSDLIQHSRQKIESLVQMGTTLATTR